MVVQVDRLTRSLADFAEMVELFDARAVYVVAVAQQFDTTTSIGRLTLTCCCPSLDLSGGGRRTDRDKIQLPSARGCRSVAQAALGCDVGDRRLVMDSAEAETVDDLQRYLELRRHKASHGTISTSIVLSPSASSPRASNRTEERCRGALCQVLSRPVYIRDPAEEAHPANIDRLLDTTCERVTAVRNSAAKCRAHPTRLRRARWRASC